jgi:hypothetical protein
LRIVSIATVENAMRQKCATRSLTARESLRGVRRWTFGVRIAVEFEVGVEVE